jgi:hypothetical protein
MMFIMVDFPLPFGPKRAYIPLPRVMFTLLSAVTLPYFFEMFFSSSISVSPHYFVFAGFDVDKQKRTFPAPDVLSVSVVGVQFYTDVVAGSAFPGNTDSAGKSAPGIADVAQKPFPLAVKIAYI